MGRIKIIRKMKPTIRAVVILIPPLSPFEPSHICSNSKELKAINVLERL